MGSSKKHKDKRKESSSGRKESHKKRHRVKDERSSQSPRKHKRTRSGGHRSGGTTDGRTSNAASAAATNISSSSKRSSKGHHHEQQQDRKPPMDYADLLKEQQQAQSRHVQLVDLEPYRSKDEHAGYDSGATVGAGGDISLSISETNKLRAKLGLKPLESKDAHSFGSTKTEAGGASKTDEFVHRPAESLTDKRFVEKLREKISVQKQKREFTEKLGKVKAIAESDSDNDGNALNWVSKSRQIETEKRKAAERAKMLEEMDAEFGIGNLVEDEFKKIKGEAYSAKDLRGLTVQHAKGSFTEGKITVLTLKDKGVLDEDGDDVLINVNIVDDERAAKNVEIKKGKPTYNPYDDDDIDDYGRVIDKSLLSKYDEEIEGEKKKSFTLGSSGTVGSESERDIIMQRLRQKQGEVTLDRPALRIANEYYTDEEMANFKKPTKFRKVRKKVKPLKADELIGMSGNRSSHHSSVSSNQDLGSRGQERKYRQIAPPVLEFKHPWEQDDDSKDDMELDEPDFVEETDPLVFEPDEAELELHLALNKARKLKHLEDRVKTGPELILANLRAAGVSASGYGGIKKERVGSGDGGDDDKSGDDAEGEGGKASIVLNSTAEFCRALGDIPTYGMSGNRDEDVDDIMDYDAEVYGGGGGGDDKIKVDVDADDEDVVNDGWNEVKANSTKPTAKIKKEDVTILDEEPDLGTGVAGALQLAMKKGYLEQEIKKVFSAPRHTTLEAASYTIEDKNFMEDDRQGRRERYAAGPVTDFRDKDGYRPDVKLEYIDDGGRLLTPKEAFRYLSHKFHGKGSGKNKTEKRMKKVQEESLMKQMSSTDTPLGTLALLQDKQKQTQSPYIVLSGGSKAINPSIISKTK